MLITTIQLMVESLIKGNFDVNGDGLDPQSEEFKGQMLEAARALKLSLKNLVEQKKKK